jgi:hypothetical protein
MEYSSTILTTFINPCPTQVLVGNLAACLVCKEAVVGRVLLLYMFAQGDTNL